MNAVCSLHCVTLLLTLQVILALAMEEPDTEAQPPVSPYFTLYCLTFNLLQIALGAVCGCMFARVHLGIRELIFCFHGLPERILQERNGGFWDLSRQLLALQNCTSCSQLFVMAYREKILELL